ncbi:hypothetical protein K1W69_19385 [Hoeflea sp. WL0058]|uniref:Uncharacterized protein n=1 Tax=Flavimaribacter sediminis TaxID=2865987 RepID=A0AAE3D308_9HYPH|nr:hypothetical protein [Flavimaribacter sediminis]MBW8639366.1 hypothetical protein [Flavimaribacter sediminis]
MSGLRVVLVLLALWIALQTGSYVTTSDIEGPRNIDTGFKRLDVFFKWQIAALAVALVAAAAGFVGPDKRWRKRLIGLAPLGLTLAAVGGLALVGLIIQNAQTPDTSFRPTTAPAATATE